MMTFIATVDFVRRHYPGTWRGAFALGHSRPSSGRRSLVKYFLNNAEDSTVRKALRTM